MHEYNKDRYSLEEQKFLHTPLNGKANIQNIQQLYWIPNPMKLGKDDESYIFFFIYVQLVGATFFIVHLGSISM